MPVPGIDCINETSGVPTCETILKNAHKDVTTRLMEINPELAKEARKVLDVNKQERHIRGGMATKEKYLHACAR